MRSRRVRRAITSPQRLNFPIAALLPTTKLSVDHRPMTERGRLQWLSAGCVQVMLQIPAQQIRRGRRMYQRIATCGRAQQGAMTARWEASALELRELKPLISQRVTTARDTALACGAWRIDLRPFVTQEAAILASRLRGWNVVGVASRLHSSYEKGFCTTICKSAHSTRLSEKRRIRS